MTRSKLIDPAALPTMSFDWGVINPLVSADDTEGAAVSLVHTSCWCPARATSATTTPTPTRSSSSSPEPANRWSATATRSRPARVLDRLGKEF